MDTGDFDSGDVGGHGGHDGAFDLGVGFGSHCGHGHLGFHSNVDMSMTGGVDGELAVNNDSRRDFSFKVVGHGEAQIATLTQRIAGELSLVERAIDMGGQRKLDLNKQGIVSIKGASGETAILPEGGVEGASGFTILWRNFYSLGSRGFLGSIVGRSPVLDRGTSVRIRVAAVQWYLPLTDDYETRIVISVQSPNSVYNAVVGDYCINAGELKSHLAAARKLAESLNKALTDSKASAYSASKRAQSLTA
ncbi:MAG: hypothetical protein IPP57_14280 [Candidatus Obscuribacter sp.]|jgi:hypothetical protein|nr:hypothetical protein [Candidatus Obscuribacter sp.]MBK7839771.1 hypothetical protein [Candidatus Obscuribacter sp.]MBK9200893.1 hypothetical protein [Candidatus Obscuribacter sp.]MBK9771964.1 hypothetical protein [Candidatus Obscuribacter sp.]MBL0186087.1 hypothetical protein [Candidatus Obscuribacter sp.]